MAPSDLKSHDFRPATQPTEANELLRPLLLLDATITSHTRAQTGIQRVTRSLYAALQKQAQICAICRDPYQQTWRVCRSFEISNLHPNQPGAASRGSRWSLIQKLTGRMRRWLDHEEQLPASGGLICPEIFSEKTAARLPELLARVSGPRIAIFYDAIALQHPEFTPPGTVARFPKYLRELLLFDGVAAISQTSAQVLRDYWKWLGVTNPPPVAAINLAINPAPQPDGLNPTPPATRRPRILYVSTIEARKNHLALLHACEDLWTQGLAFELQLIGMARPDTAGRALEKIQALQQAGRPLIYAGSASDDALARAYAGCTFTVYPSLIEGFGLPVLESLQYGKPCVCSSRGALGECARDGGCLVLDSVDAHTLTDAIRRLLQSPGELTALTNAARARTFKTWADYAAELTGWMQTLPRRS